MAALWDPRALLDIYPEHAGFTCVGTTKQGRRCRQKMISHTSLREARNILHVLQQQDIFQHNFSDLVYPKLHRLAVVTLCPLWHRNDRPTAKSQADEVTLKWVNIVDRYIYDGLYSQQTPAQILPPTALPSAILTISSNATGQPAAEPATHNHTHHVLNPSLLPTPAHSQNQAQITASNTPIAIENPHQQTQAAMLAQALLSNPPLQAILTEILNIVIQSSTNHHHHSHDLLTPSTPPPSGPTLPQPTPQTDSIITWLNTDVQATSAPSTPSVPRPSTPVSEIFTPTSTLSQLTPPSSLYTASTLSMAAAGPVPLFPSPPESIWSMGPPTETSNAPSIISEISSRSPTPSLPEEDLAHEPSPASPDEHPTSSINELASEPAAPVIAAPTAALAAPQATQPHNITNSNTSPSATASSTAVVTAVPSPSGSHSSTHSLSPVIRKPLTDCPVCFLPITDASDAVWCRGSCGQNMCYGCFLLWINQLLDQGRQVACGYW